MALSRFFTLDELTRSDTAARLGIPNTPDGTQLANLTALCGAVLDPLREAIGMPVKINSGFRSQRVNEAIPGSAKVSQHLEGKAADIVTSGMSVLDLFKRVLQLGLPFDQIIYEAKSPQSKWVHVSHDAARQRGEIMVANFQPGGRVTYTRITQEAALAMSEPVLRERAMPMQFEESHDAPPDEPPAAAPAPKAPAKKAAAKKAQAKKAPSKKAAAKKASVKKAVTKKAPAKQAVARRPAATKAAVKAAAKKAAAKKAAAKRASPKKAAAKKPAARRAAPKK
jgi:hypothetical protein